MPDPTPFPWRLCNCGCGMIFGSNGDRIARIETHPAALPAPPEQQAANARLIPIACECHDELVRVCTILRRRINATIHWARRDDPTSIEIGQEIDAASAILTKAHEGQVARGDTECPPTASTEETSPAKQ